MFVPATRYRSLCVLAAIAPEMHPSNFAFQQAPAVLRHRRRPNDAIAGLAIDLFRILAERSSPLVLAGQFRRPFAAIQQLPMSLPGAG